MDSANNISVLIAEDHHDVRKGLSSLLSLEQDIELIGEAEDGNEAVMMVRDLCPYGYINACFERNRCPETN